MDLNKNKNAEQQFTPEEEASMRSFLDDLLAGVDMRITQPLNAQAELQQHTVAPS